MPEFPDIVLYAIPFFIIAMLLELYVTTKKNIKTYEAKDAFSSIAMGLGNVFLGIFNKIIVLFALFLVYDNFRFFTMPTNIWWSFVLVLFLDDFTYYWYHRISHECRFFWASHVVHHSSQHYNLSTALRQTWSGGFFSFIFWLWLALLGFHPAMLLFQMGISLLYQFWIHTEAINKMPKWFEAVMNTPSHHRVHHGSNPLYLDRNHAGIFIIWDKLFGTFQPEVKDEKVVYGLVSNINTYNPIKIAFIEWINLFKDAFSGRKSFFSRLKYFIKPPGWKHDGTGLISDDLRKDWLKETQGSKWRFENKVIWITGASSGIGKGLALELSQKNCKLILSSRRENALEEVKNQCNNPKNIAILPFDLAYYGNMKVVVKDALQLFGHIDVLINNGGISQRSLIIDTDISVDKKLIEIDYLATVALSKAILPHFVERQSGHFAVVTSLMGKFSSPYRSGYCGAKHALHGFFDALRMEHEKDNIKVTLVCPGFVNTNVAKNALIGDGSQQTTQDDATKNGLSVEDFSKRMLKAITKEKFEVYIGKKEVLGVYLKRFFPKILHKFVLRSTIK